MKLPYELVSEILKYSKNASSCSVNKSFYNECVKNSLFEEEFINDLSKKVQNIQKRNGDFDEKGIEKFIEKTRLENLYHNHICKKYNIKYFIDILRVRDYLKKVKSRYDIPKKDANFAVVRYTDREHRVSSIFQNSEFLKYFKTADEANDFAFKECTKYEPNPRTMIGNKFGETLSKKKKEIF